MATITLYVASSLDGFIAEEDGGVAWLETFEDTYERGLPGGSYTGFFATIDCLIIGRRTYQQMLTFGEWPFGQTPTFVITHHELPAQIKAVRFYSGDLTELVNKVIKPEYDRAWLVGGAVLAQEFLRLNLVDDIRLSIIPILLGKGITLFGNSGRGHTLHLNDVTAYQNGITELWYEVNKG